MSFDEDFPDLPIIDFTDRYKAIGKVCRCKDIRKYCKDNQRIKEAIKKHFVHAFTGDGTVHSSGCRMCKVLKELGLED